MQQLNAISYSALQGSMPCLGRLFPRTCSILLLIDLFRLLCFFVCCVGEVVDTAVEDSAGQVLQPEVRVPVGLNIWIKELDLGR